MCSCLTDALGDAGIKKPMHKQDHSKHSWRGAASVAALILLIQLALLASSFPLFDAFSGEFAWHIDNPYHLYQVELGRSLLKQGALTGLDPFFGAGYLGGVGYNVSARLPVLIGGLLPATISTAVIYSVYLLASALIAPLAVVAMARVLRWPLIHTAFAALIGLAFWWIGAMRWFHTAGMVSFVCASYLSAAYGAWVWTICNRTAQPAAIRGVVLAGIAGGLGIWFHPLFAVMVAAWFLALLIANWRGVHWRALFVSVTIIVAIALAMNLPWVLAMLGSPSIANESPYQKSVGVEVGLKPLLGIWSDQSMGSFLNPLVVLACVAGMVWFDRIRPLRIAPLFGVGVAMLLFAAFGAASPKLAILQPNRFIAPAFLFLGLGAASCLGDIAIWLRRSSRPAPRLLAVAAAALFSLYAGREIYREATPGPHGHYGRATTELTATPALISQLGSWILANTSTDGRILFETSLGRVHGGGHTAGMIAIATGREFIGAPYPHSLPQVSFWDNIGLGEPISKLTTAQLLHGLNYYNVGWIIAHSPGLIALAAQAENAQPVAQFGAIRIFKIQRPLSFVVSGTGQVKARGFNKIEVAGASGPELTLRYNWIPGLVSTPRARMEPARVEAGMPPLIRILSPPANFTISVCRACGSE
jgi:hypothetical protein